jgi:hypothetical protein
MTVAVVARRAQSTLSGTAAGTRLPFAPGGTHLHVPCLHFAAPAQASPSPSFARPGLHLPLVGHSGDHFLHSLEPAA